MYTVANFCESPQQISNQKNATDFETDQKNYFRYSGNQIIQFFIIEG